MGDNGRLLIGDKGFILGQTDNSVFPAECAKAAQAVARSIPRSAGHHAEWVAACKGGKAAGSYFDWAGPLAEAVLLGNVALRVQLFNKSFKGKVLVCVGAQAGLAHSPEQLGEARVSGQVGAQYQRVDKEADQPFRLRPAASRDGRADADILLCAIA